jgi:hypothetical protein
VVGLGIWRETKTKKGDISLGLGGKGRAYKNKNLKNKTVLLHVKLYKAQKKLGNFEDPFVAEIYFCILWFKNMASKQTKPLFTSFPR